MCTCRHFDVWDRDDAGRATGCAFIVYPGDYGDRHYLAERMQYCHVTMHLLLMERNDFFTGGTIPMATMTSGF
jgi:hypothetical protein